jgi:hypothetical protein
MKKKKLTPHEAALLEKLNKARDKFERLYSRLKRVFGQLEKARQTAIRLQRRLEKLGTDTTGGGNEA